MRNMQIPAMRENCHIGFLDIYDISELFDNVIREFREAYENIEMSLERFALGELPARLQPEIWI